MLIELHYLPRATDTFLYVLLLNTGKIKRGLQRLLSLSKSKSGKGVRILRPGGASSRKVRFNEDPHSSKSPAAQQQPGAAGTAAAGVGPVKGSSVIKKAVAAPGALKSGIRFAEPASAEPGPGSAAAGAKQASLQAGHTAVSQASDAAGNGAPASSATMSSIPAASDTRQPTGQLSISAVASAQPSKPGAGAQLQPPSSSRVNSSAGAGSSAYGSSSSSRGSSGEGSSAPSMMAVYLQQQSEQQPPQTPSFAAGSSSGNLAGNSSGNWAGSSSGNWEACSRTGLAGGPPGCSVGPLSYLGVARPNGPTSVYLSHLQSVLHAQSCSRDSSNVLGAMLCNRLQQ